MQNQGCPSIVDFICLAEISSKVTCQPCSWPVLDLHNSLLRILLACGCAGWAIYTSHYARLALKKLCRAVWSVEQTPFTAQIPANIVARWSQGTQLTETQLLVHRLPKLLGRAFAFPCHISSSQLTNCTRRLHFTSFRTLSYWPEVSERILLITTFASEKLEGCRTRFCRKRTHKSVDDFSSEGVCEVINSNKTTIGAASLCTIGSCTLY